MLPDVHAPRRLSPRLASLARRGLVLLLTLSCCLPAWPAGEEGVRYRASMGGLGDAALRSLLESVSDTFSLADRPPPTEGLLRQRVERDLPVMVQALRSRGYLDAKVAGAVENQAGPQGARANARFTVETGRLYKLRQSSIVEAGAGRVQLPTPGEIGLRPGLPAESRLFLEADDALLLWLGHRGYPLARIVGRRVRSFRAESAVEAEYRVETGPALRFGGLRVRGLRTVDESYLRTQVPWRPGARFDTALLPEFQRRLTLSRVFASARVTPASTASADGTLPVEVLVAERKHRSIEVGASYKTDVGAGSKLAWENRNFRGRGERLAARAELTGIGFQTATSYRKPGFGRPDQTLMLELNLADDTPEAYHSRNVGLSAGVERMLGARRFARAGVASKFSEVTQLGRRDSFQMLMFPLQLEDDTSDDILDPTRGYRLELRVVPSVDPFGDGVEFVRSTARMSGYWRLGDDDRLVLATRGVLGSVAGASRLDVPADERFYAGGGNSVRGYAYQSVGPGDGLQTRGGRSLAEFSLELRLKTAESMGVVGFLDGGGAFESELPDFSGRVLWGAGLGYRYYTPVGPVRIDVAVPLDKRRGIDSDYQVYFSVGQAF
jgi:translocation and assembly module TamA